LRNMDKMVMFGYYGLVENGILLESVQDLVRKRLSHIEVTSSDLGLCITARNFSSLKQGNQSLVYENDHHKNYICIVKSPNFKVECLRILRKNLGNLYHKYIYKDIIDMIFGKWK